MENIKFGDTKEVILNKLKYTSRMVLPINSKLDVDVDDILHTLIVQLETVTLYIQGKTLFIPENFWQHFKHEVFPSWLVKIFPIKYCKYEARLLLTNYAIDDSKQHTLKVIEKIDEIYSETKLKNTDSP